MKAKILYSFVAIALTTLSLPSSAQSLRGRVETAKAAAPAPFTLKAQARVAAPASPLRATTPTDYGTEEDVLTEDFSLMPTGSIGAPDETVVLTSDSLSSYPVWIRMKPEYTHTPGWGGHEIYPAGGCVALSATEFTNLNTPMLDCSKHQGIVFLEFQARADADATGQLVVEAAETYNMQPSWSFLGSNYIDVTSEWQTYRVQYQGAGKYTMFNFSKNEGSQDPVQTHIYIDNVKVYTINPYITMPSTLPYTDYTGQSFVAHWTKVGDAAKYLVNVYNASSDMRGNLNPGDLLKKDIEVTDTFTTISGIESGATYYYTVRAVNAEGKESFETQPEMVFDLVAPVLEKATINGAQYNAKWSAVPSAERYNYWAFSTRTASADGEFTVTDEPLSGLQMPDGSDIDWTVDEPRTYVYPNYYLAPAAQAGWDAKNGLPFPDCVGVDGYQYVFNHEDAGLVSPELDLSKDGGKATIKVQLRGERGDVWYNDGTKETRTTRACVAVFNWDDALGDYKQAELIYTDSVSPDKFSDYTVNITKGSARTKVGIYAIWAPGYLFIKNLKVTQNYKQGDTFVNPYYFGRYLEDTQVDVTVPARAYDTQLSHKVCAVKVNPTTMQEKDSPYSATEQVGVVAGIGRVSLAQGQVSVDNGRLNVTGSGRVEVYTLDGKQVYGGKAGTPVQLKSGAYIVRTENNTVKVVF